MKFVQIGACAGGDEVFDFVKDKEVEFGLLVEPIPDFKDRLLECYKDVKNIHLEQSAVVPEGVIDEAVSQSRSNCFNIFIAIAMIYNMLFEY